MSVKINILDYVYDGSSNIDWTKSIVGELDVTDHSDFPLALSFQISDIKDITATSGDYSKTFKVPATKNNNQLLRNLYTANILKFDVTTGENVNSATENMPCQILVDELYSTVGTIKVTGVGGYGEKVSFYNCVFYGNNLGWAFSLDNQYMNTIDWETYGDNLVYKKPEIMATWSDEHSDSSTSPIVYPITSYGDFNFSVQEPYIQLLDTKYDALGTGSASTIGYYGYFNNGLSYGTPKPSPDWRPALFVKTTLEKIFKKVGYTISSTFMDTDMFKKLVWLLPNFTYNNPNDRYDEYAVETEFLDETTLVAPRVPLTGTEILPEITDNGITRFVINNISEDNLDYVAVADNNYFYTGAGRADLSLNTSAPDKNLKVNLDENSRLSGDIITIGEYGYYDLRIRGLQAKVARLYKGGAQDQKVFFVTAAINVEVKTVGQTSWNIVGQLQHGFEPLTESGSQGVDENNPSFTEYINIDDLVLEGVYLNEGDQIKLSRGMKLNALSSIQNFSLNIFWKTSGASAFDVAFAPNYVEYGQTYNLNNVINKDYKQIDFIKGIAHAFNLKITTNETSKIVEIEPFNSFYDSYANALDWTYKLDRSKEVNDKWMKTNLKNNFIFKYKTDDKDATVQYRALEYFKGIEDEYPYQEDLGSNFERGESIFENPFFAGTFNAKDQDTTGVGTKDNPFSGCLWQEKEDDKITSANDEARPPKCFEFSPRLLYWNKYSPASQVGEKTAIAQTWTSIYQNITADASGSGNLSNIYPQATSINRDKTTPEIAQKYGYSDSSPILSYGNVWHRDYDDSTGEYTDPPVAGKGLYEEYYKNMFEQFKRNPRIRTAYFDLKITDIINLDLRKLIYLDGVYWRLNKVSDYMPNNNNTTKVELIEWIEVGDSAASIPTFGSSSGSTGNDSSWGNSPISKIGTDNQNNGI